MNQLPKIEVRETGKREFELLVAGNVIGTSKTDVDANHGARHGLQNTSSRILDPDSK